MLIELFERVQVLVDHAPVAFVPLIQGPDQHLDVRLRGDLRFDFLTEHLARRSLLLHVNRLAQHLHIVLHRLRLVPLLHLTHLQKQELLVVTEAAEQVLREQEALER